MGNLLQELQIKEMEQSMVKDKAEIQTIQPNYKKETEQPLKEKAKTEQIGNLTRNVIKKEKSRKETILPINSKLKMKRMEEHETVVPSKKETISNNQYSPTKNLKLKMRKMEIQGQES